VSLLHVHGTADANHPIDGGVGEDGISGVDFRSASSSVDALADAIGCPEGSVTIRQGDLLVRDRAPCDGGAVVRFVTIAGAEHAWPGSSAGGRGVGGAPYPGYDASTEIWGFFAEVGP
jgi:poly(3-hydroxybutyrate) depolymerase